MPVVFLVTISAILAGRVLRHTFGFSRLAVAGALLGASVVLWVVARRLHEASMRRAVREIDRPTGSTRGVPRWVEELGNVAFGFALAGLIPLVEEFVPD